MKKGENEIGLTILMPFSISPSMSVPPVTNNRLCSRVIVQAIPAAGSIWAVREQIGRNSGVISFFLFDKKSCSREHVGLGPRELQCRSAAALQAPPAWSAPPKLPKRWKPVWYPAPNTQRCLHMSYHHDIEKPATRKRCIMAIIILKPKHQHH